MSVNCISCRRFTVKDRVAHETSDKRMLAQGMGRCLDDKDPAHYHSAEYLRECAGHVPLEQDQVLQRRSYLAKRRG